MNHDAIVELLKFGHMAERKHVPAWVIYHPMLGMLIKEGSLKEPWRERFMSFSVPENWRILPLEEK